MSKMTTPENAFWIGECARPRHESSWMERSLWRVAGNEPEREQTADGMSLEKIDTLTQAVRQERYQWKPARRTYISKKNGKKRPLGMPVWSDKLLAEVMRMILDAYFDGTFSDHSHGFRSERGCHTALRDIYQTWKGTVWLIEGDIADCFGSLDHELILSALAEHIQDGRFLNLVKKLLDAGYLEDWTWHKTLSGVPQGSIRT